MSDYVTAERIKGVTRPRTLAFTKFISLMDEEGFSYVNNGKKCLRPSNYVKKYDGFHIIIRMVDGAKAYFSNSGRRIRVTQTPGNMMEAIILYLETHFPTLSPDLVVEEFDTYRITGEELHLEFVAVKDNLSYLQGLYHSKCLDKTTGLLNCVDYQYDVILFDCVMKSRPDFAVNIQSRYDGGKHAYFERHRLLWDVVERLVDEQRDTSSPESKRINVCEMLESADSIIDTLLTEEGLIMQRPVIRGVARTEDCLKIKMPRKVMKLNIVAVARTISDFAGYNLIYAAAPTGDGQTWSVIHVFNWTDLFNDVKRPGQGKAFLGKSKTLIRDGRLRCDTKSSIQPLVDAVFQAVHDAEPTEAVKFTRHQVTARMADGGQIIISCDKGRSFSFTDDGLGQHNGFYCLKKPVPVTVGAGELWPLTNSIHLQPAWLLALDGYGPPEYLSIESFTNLGLLQDIARNPSLTPSECYRMVGMKSDPFLGKEAQIRRDMTVHCFCVRLC